MEHRRKATAFAVFFIVVGIIAGLAVSSNLNIFNKGYGQEVKISKDSVDILSRTNQAMSEVAAAVRPAVVNISMSQTVHMRNMPFFDDPFFKQFFGDRGRPRDYKQYGLGSGVIVAKDGFIVTNYHVVRDADEIRVRLSDKREFKGKVVGADAKTDLAVVKIDASNLPVLPLGDSEKIRVGDTVIAVGNPFGLNQTVTSGIVSAKGRADVGLADYEDFIQTDAAINPGNSGGALVNIMGELIGINTAIVSSSGGYQGVGFAIPSNMVKTVMESLIKKGKVVRGWLGVSIQPLTPELSKELGVKSDKGALIADVVEDGPAARAGLQRGDVVTKIDGKDITDVSALKNIVASIPPGRAVKVEYLRGGETKTAAVTIAEMTGQQQKMLGQAENQFKGVSVRDLTPDIRRQLGIPGRLRGVVVTDVAEESPAAGVLAQGDVIMEINRKKIGGVSDYGAAVNAVKSGQRALVLVYRNGSTLYITM